MSAGKWFQQHRRRIGVLFMLVFAGGGIWFFSGRMPHEVLLRMELPPSVGTPLGRLTRADMKHLAGVVFDAENIEVGRFAIEQQWQGEAPLSKATALRLKRGTYRLEAKAAANERGLALRDPESGPDLLGMFEVHGPGEVRVDVRAPAREAP